jgi:hypothetical protein
MTYSEFRVLTLSAIVAADASDARPLDVSLARRALAAADAAFDAALVLDDGSDVGLALDADYREAVLGGLGG